MEISYLKNAQKVKRNYYRLRFGSATLRIFATHAEMLNFWIPLACKQGGQHGF